MDPVQKGRRAAMWLFAVVGVIHVGLFIASLIVKSLALTTALAGLFTLPGSLIAALVISFSLEREARGSFWLSVIIGVVALVAIWFGTCAGALNLGGL